MIHGLDKDAVKRQVEQVISQCGLTDYRHDILFSRRCFKQRGAAYPVSKTPVKALQPLQVTDLG